MNKVERWRRLGMGARRLKLFFRARLRTFFLSISRGIKKGRGEKKRKKKNFAFQRKRSVAA